MVLGTYRFYNHDLSSITINFSNPVEMSRLVTLFILYLNQKVYLLNYCFVYYQIPTTKQWTKY